MIEKTLQDIIDERFVNKKYSNSKSTDKGFIAFFQQFANITQKYSVNLYQLGLKGTFYLSAGDYMTLKSPLTQCKIYEHINIKQIIQQTLAMTINLSKLYESMKNKVKQTLIDSFNILHEQHKKSKDKYLENISRYKSILQIKNKNESQRRLKEYLEQMIKINQQIRKNEEMRQHKIKQNTLIFCSFLKGQCKNFLELYETYLNKFSKEEYIFTFKEYQIIQKRICNYIYSHYNCIVKFEEKNSINKDNIKKNQDEKKKIRQQQQQYQNIFKAKKYLQQIGKINTNQDFVINYTSTFNIFSQNDHSQVMKYFSDPFFKTLVYMLMEWKFFYQKQRRQFLLKIKSKLLKQNIIINYNDLNLVSQTLNGLKQVHQSFQNIINVERNSKHREILGQIVKIYNLILILNKSWYSKHNNKHFDIHISKKNIRTQLLPIQPLQLFQFPLNVGIINILLDVLKSGKNTYLIENFQQMFNLVCSFGQTYCGLKRNQIKLLLLKKFLYDDLFKRILLRDQSYVQFLSELRQLINQQQSSFNNQLQEQIKIYLYNQSKIQYFFIRYFIIRFYQFLPSDNVLTIKQLVRLLQLFEKNCKIYQTNKQNNENKNQNIYVLLHYSSIRYLQLMDKKKLLDKFFKYNQNFTNINQILELIHKALKQINIENDVIVGKYMKAFSEALSQDENQQTKVLGKIIDGFFGTILKIVISALKITKDSVIKDQKGIIFKIALEISLLEKIINKHTNKKTEYFQGIIQLLEKYLDSVQIIMIRIQEFKKLLLNVREAQIWRKGQDMDCTNSCIDFCSLIIKPFQILDKLLLQNPNVDFKMRINQKLSKFIQSQIESYLKYLKKSLRKYQVYTEFKIPKFLDQQIPFKTITQKIVDSNCTFALPEIEFNQICIRMQNFVFLQNTIDTINITNKQCKQYLIKIFNKYREVIIFKKGLQNIIAKTFIYMCIEYVFFRNLYFDLAKELNSNSKSNYATVSKFSMYNLRNEFDPYLNIIKKQLPQGEQLNVIKKAFDLLQKRTKVFMLDPNRFRIQKSHLTIIEVLLPDFKSFSDYLKSRMQQQNWVKQMEEIYEQKIFKLIEKIRFESFKLISEYEQMMIKNDKAECELLIRILYLRRGQKKTKQFVKKYMHLYKI